jgi:hypothetical protein
MATKLTRQQNLDALEKKRKPVNPLPAYWEEEPKEAEEGQPVCKICFERPVTTYCVPCTHALMCVRCCRELRKLECPLCRSKCKRIRRIQKIIYG